MDDEAILECMAQVNFAALYLDKTTKLGPGRALWADQLARLTPAQRLNLEVRLEHWQALRLRSLAKSASNSVNVARLDNAAPTWSSKQAKQR
ncbi:MAG TPA: hypothetical protein VHV10_04515 [Ktedonobacteraceae bacterium]|jgi:hypothetical protein|nr:hypothetical protein [Ktedonobacteraceae bacterium]